MQRRVDRFPDFKESMVDGEVIGDRSDNWIRDGQVQVMVAADWLIQKVMGLYLIVTDRKKKL